MIPDELFTPEEAVLISRLQNAPQVKLKPQAMDAIRAQLFAEMDAPVKPFWRTTIGMTSLAVVTAVIIIVIIIIGVSVTGGDDKSPTVIPNPSESPTETLGVTPTPEPTLTVMPETPATVIIQTPISPTPQATATSAVSVGAPILVIEGPVSAIDINTITVFDMTIQVDAGNPILAQLQVGDRVRIDGQTTLDGNTIIIVAVNITIIDVQIIVEPSGGLPANCKLTGFGNGRITCKGSRRTTRD